MDKPTAFDIVKQIINYKGSLPLTSTDKLILMKYVTHMNYNIQGYTNRLGCFVGQEEVSECSGGITTRAVRDSLKKLVEFGFIAVVKRYNNTDLTFWIGFPEEEVVNEVPEIDESIFIQRKVVIVTNKKVNVKVPKAIPEKVAKDDSPEIGSTVVPFIPNTLGSDRAINLFSGNVLDFWKSSVRQSST